MRLGRTAAIAAVAATVSAGSALVQAQKGEEKFTGTASVKTAAGAAATAPVTIVISHKMTQQEADKYLGAFRSGGAAALRKALDGVKPTGSVRIGNGPTTPTRLTLERATGSGRLLTMVTDKPILFLGAGLPGAKPKEGYDFAVIDIEVDAAGTGSGTLAPAAKIRVNEGAFVVEDYGAESIRIAGVKKAG
jgi:hypothetical protein